ncbi:RHS repeat-associated core domain-containing protein [Microbacterium sp. STF-2]|uniref:RHS repeat-associated core domain-containing protein n=1 Tax=Microbacterium sp. STF-2 TaxID=3031132 RepID=UPI002AFDD827|nr:RHS repeat-associated core domain-containing protein [Microbacterium sp. STF-2]MEA1263460.1 RHS repeat-associated core domain-containing protein [Microbacterium sp. STF-2]
MGATTYTHDSLGRVTSVKDGNGNTTRYDYDARGRIVLTTYQDGQTVTSTYLANGLEDTRVDSGGGAINFDYNHQGLILKQTGPRAGVTQTMTYDEVGNMLTYADSGGTVTYSYDAANQLTRLQEPGGTCPASGVLAANSGCVLFEYNNNSLETKRTTPGGATTVTTRDASDRPTPTNTFFGTGNTDRLSSGAVTFNNSAIGLMQRVTSGATVNYTRTPDGTVVGQRGASPSYYFQDHLGSVVGLATAAGGYSGGYSYSPYGEARFTSTNAAVAANNLRYIGEHQDSTGVYKLGARFYDPGQGRFTQMDPSGQERSPYSYAACDPVNLSDSTGLDVSADCWRQAGALIGPWIEAIANPLPWMKVYHVVEGINNFNDEPKEGAYFVCDQ